MTSSKDVDVTLETARADDDANLKPISAPRERRYELSFLLLGLAFCS